MFEIDSEFTLERDIKNRVSHPIEMWEFPQKIGKSLFAKSMTLMLAKNHFLSLFLYSAGTQMAHSLRDCKSVQCVVPRIVI